MTMINKMIDAARVVTKNNATEMAMGWILLMIDGPKTNQIIAGIGTKGMLKRRKEETRRREKGSLIDIRR